MQGDQACRVLEHERAGREVRRVHARVVRGVRQTPSDGNIAGGCSEAAPLS